MRKLMPGPIGMPVKAKMINMTSHTPKKIRLYGSIKEIKVPSPAFLSYSRMKAKTIKIYGLSGVMMFVDESAMRNANWTKAGW